MLSCTANPRAGIGFCGCRQMRELEIIGIISFISSPEFTLFLAVIKTLGEECFVGHSLEPQEGLIKALSLFTSIFFLEKLAQTLLVCNAGELFSLPPPLFPLYNEYFHQNSIPVGVISCLPQHGGVSGHSSCLFSSPFYLSLKHFREFQAVLCCEKVKTFLKVLCPLPRAALKS